MEPSRIQLLYNIGNERTKLSEQEAVGRWRVVTCSSQMLKHFHVLAGTPADILPLVEAFPKFKDTDKEQKDKGLFLMSLRVAGAAQLTFQTEPVPDGCWPI